MMCDAPRSNFQRLLDRVDCGEKKLKDLEESIRVLEVRGLGGGTASALHLAEEKNKRLRIERDAKGEMLEVVTAQRDDLLEAVRWALGTNGYFAERSIVDWKYWWRTGLANRARLIYDDDQYHLVKRSGSPALVPPPDQSFNVIINEEQTAEAEVDRFDILEQQVKVLSSTVDRLDRYQGGKGIKVDNRLKRVIEEME